MPGRSVVATARGWRTTDGAVADAGVTERPCRDRVLAGGRNGRDPCRRTDRDVGGAHGRYRPHRWRRHLRSGRLCGNHRRRPGWRLDGGKANRVSDCQRKLTAHHGAVRLVVKQRLDPQQGDGAAAPHNLQFTAPKQSLCRSRVDKEPVTAHVRDRCSASLPRRLRVQDRLLDQGWTNDRLWAHEPQRLRGVRARGRHLRTCHGRGTHGLGGRRSWRGQRGWPCSHDGQLPGWRGNGRESNRIADDWTKLAADHSAIRLVDIHRLDP